MSYTRSFTKTIAVHYSGSVSYPASQSGGTKSYSGTAYETVTVNVNVDTDPFDSSVAQCNNGVGLLTGSVVATESAQVASIGEAARKVGSTIVKGFFKTVQSEISQQIAELRANIDSHLIHLRELSKRCVAKQTQMSNDYRRLRDRYSKLFTDLDNELENRIYSLDQPAFRFRRQADELSSDTSEGAALATVGATEGSALHARIAASVAKRDAMQSIGRANAFLRRQQSMDRLLSHCLLDTPANGLHYVPVAYVETVSGAQGRQHATYLSHLIDRHRAASIGADMESESWSARVSADDASRIRSSFNTLVAENMAGGDEHADRVRRYMCSLFNLDDTSAIASQTH